MTAMMVILGVLTVCAACGVVVARKPLNSALSLVVTLFLVAAHFAVLEAHFLAAIQVMVYAGAIMVLVIFVIMLLGIGDLPSPHGGRISRIIAAVGSGVFVALLWGGIAFSGVIPEEYVRGGGGGAAELRPFGTAESVGRTLFTRFVYPFEIASVLLLSAIIGAVVLALEPKRKLPRDRGLRAIHEERD